MIYSRHNIFSKIHDSENYFIVNLLRGSADILPPEEAAWVQKVRAGEEIPPKFAERLSDQGYLTPLAEEEQLFRRKYLDFLDQREQDEIQLFFVTNYACNFSCSYCYQDQYETERTELNESVTDAFFSWINQKFQNRKKYLTLFGGEPLLNSPHQRRQIGYLLKKAGEAGLETCIVTNGYHLTEYMDILSAGRIREIQVTLDGMPEQHDARRFLKGGGATFDKIVQGIDACLQHSLPVNLRMVIDRDNIGELPRLARFAIDRGWTKSSLFKTQIGRNYELHHCQQGNERLFSRISLYESIYQQIKDHPHILEFHKPAFSVAKFLAENGELPEPLFDACPACKTEWAFDYTGQIYSCTATVGKNGESLGTFYPAVSLNESAVRAWENRDVTAIEACRSCELQLACGGGCGSVAKNNNGNLCTTDCRPMKGLLELGLAAYGETK